MPNVKIACMLGNLRMEPYAAMEKVAELNVTGVHLSVGGGPFAPENLDKPGRRELVRHLASLGLEVSAVSAWGGEVDLGDEEPSEANVARGAEVMEMAVDLECGIWQGHCGIMPPDMTGPRWETFLRNMTAIARHGERLGACLAIETGPEPPAVLKQLIETVGSQAIRVNYDPANLILWPAGFAQREGKPYSREQAWEEFAPVEGAKLLAPYIVHTHAKDALVHEDGRRQEVPLGEGWIDWPKYVGYIQEADPGIYFAIERETGDDPVGDITKAVEFLKSL
jgi:sugar phosphate isomerase/epimerase